MYLNQKSHIKKKKKKKWNPIKQMFEPILIYGEP